MVWKAGPREAGEPTSELALEDLVEVVRRPRPDSTVNVLDHELVQVADGGLDPAIGARRLDRPSSVPPPFPTAWSGTGQAFPAFQSTRRDAAHRAPTDANHPLMVAARALVQACEDELAKNPDSTRAARLHFEAATKCESPLRDLTRAATHYQAVLEHNPDHLPSIRGARRALFARKAYAEGLPLFEAEIRVTSDAKQRAALHYMRGVVLLTRLADAAAARTALAAAVDLDRSHVSALLLLEELAKTAGNHRELDRWLEVHANAITNDAAWRAELVVRRAALHESELGAPDLAMELYESALSIDGRCAPAVHALKRLLHGSRRYRDLVRVLHHEASNATDPRVAAQALMRAAQLHSDRLGNRDLAIGALELAYGHDAANAGVREQLGKLYEEAGQWENAMRVLAHDADLEADSRKRLAAFHHLGRLAEQRLDSATRAIEWYQRALMIQPNHGPTLAALGVLLGREGRWDEYIAMRRAEVELLDDSRRKAAILAELGDHCEKQLQAPARAIEWHERALSVSANYAPSVRALARLFADAARFRELSELYEQALERATTDEARVTLGMRLGNIHEDMLFDPARATEAYVAVVRVAPSNVEALQALARSAERAARYGDLMGALEREAALTQDTTEAASLLVRAGEVAARNLGDTDLAIQSMRRALAVEATYAPAMDRLVELYQRTGRWESLLSVYEELVRSRPAPADNATTTHAAAAHASLLVAMGELCETHLGRDADARRLFHEAARTDPTDRTASRHLARKLRENGDFAALAEALHRELSVAKEPEYGARVAFELGEVHEESLHRLDDARDAYAKAVTAWPDFRHAVDALQRTLASLGQWQALVDELGRDAARTVEPGLALAARLRAADLLSEKLGDVAGASALCREVIAQHPGHVGALGRLTEIHRGSHNSEALAADYASLARVLGDADARVGALRELGRLEEASISPGEDAGHDTQRAILSLVGHDAVALADLERVALEQGDRALLLDLDTRLSATSHDLHARAAHLTRLAESLEWRGDDRAVSAYRAALQADGESIAATHGLSRLVATSNDPTLLTEAARREAHVSRDGRAAADLLVRSALTRLLQFDDPTGAVLDLEQALVAWPDHEPAATELTRLLRRNGDEARAVELLSRAGNAATLPERRAALWTEVAELQANELGNHQAAIAALHRVIRQAPDHVEAQLRMASLYVRENQWMEAVRLFENVVQLGGDDQAVVHAHLELSSIWHERLNDGVRALASLRAVLALAPTNGAALARMADVHEARGDLEGAVEAATRLLETSDNAIERASALLRMARLEDGRDNGPQARALMLEAAALEGPSGEAALLLKAVMHTQPEWAAYARAMEQHLEACRTLGHTPIPAYLELSRVYHGQFSDPARAVATLTSAVELSGPSPSLRFELAHRLRDAGHAQDALREFRRMLEDDATTAGTYREIFHTFEAMGHGLGARCAAEVLTVLKASEPPDAAVIAAHPPATAPWAPGALATTGLAHLFAASAGEAAAHDILREIAPYLGKLYAPDFGAFELSARDKESTKHPSPLRVMADRIARVVGLASFEVYIHQVRNRGVAVELGAPNILFVPASLVDAPAAQQAFLLAKPLLGFATGVGVLAKLTPREVEVLIAAVLRFVEPTFGQGLTSEEVLDDTKKRLLRAVSRKSRKALEEAAKQLLAQGPLDFIAWAERVDRRLIQLSTLVADDLVGSVDLLRRLERELQHREGPELVRRSPPIADLVRFWVSAEAMSLRDAALSSAAARSDSP